MSGLTLNDPVKLATALNSFNVIPGDTLLLRGGTYSGNWVINVDGTAEAPVIIKPYNHEPVIINGTLTFNNPYVKVMDVEITNSSIFVDNDGVSITMNQAGCWLIGCHIHGLHDSGVNWFGSGVGGVAECLIEGNHGHAIYTHNNGGGARLISRNLLLEQAEFVGPNQYSLHVFSGGENWLKDYTCQENVIFGNPAHTGGGLGLTNFVYSGNIQNGSYAQMGRYSPEGANDGATISNNLYIDLASYFVKDGWLNFTESNNTVWGGEPSSRAGYTVEAKPDNWSQFIPFTLSERWSGIQCSITNGVFSAQMVSL